jgi:aminoglycoside phosphotransferase (APT) family kinase protein
VSNAIAGWLADRLAADSAQPISGVEVGPLATPGAGQSNDTVIFTARWLAGDEPVERELVLRRQPTDRQLFLDADVIREAAVIAALDASIVPVPRVYFTESDPAVLGAPFFVMAKVAGTVPLARPSIHAAGWLLTLSAAQRRTVWESAMDALVAIHATDWRASHEFLAGASGSPLDDRLDNLERWYRWATAGRRFAVTDAALQHLLAARPVAGDTDPVLVWGDARVGNMIFGSDLQVAAVIDWELATIGPAEIDIGHWLFFDEFMTTAAGVPRLDGFPDPAATIARYQELSGRRLDHLDYFQLMQTFVVATTLIRQADLRVAAGELPADTRMGHDNAVTQMLARRLGLPVPELSADYLAHRRPQPDN